ncbi:MAG: flagellar basal-body rod protein FlgG [Myxococcales bacterium]|jgi:flagellar basal-body rod protein FlgG|nr:flagellar basal-body rod protein FlgG [Myxococcales bacterium]
MLRSLYTAATGMEAEQLKMDTIANNLANVNTTGFKRTRAEFQDLLSETIIAATPAGPQGGGQPAPLQVGLGVRAGTTTRSMAQGDRIGTQNPFDLAIDGPGYFRIQRANGDVAFTRAGNLRVDETGRLVTQSGEVVEPSITVPPETANLTIRPDGTVLASLPGRTDPQELGQLELTTFTNPSALSAIGNNLFQPTAATGQELRQKPGEQGMGTLSQGFLESANVKAVEEMIDMITTQRSYEMNSKVITTADQMLQKLTNLR